MSLKFEDIYKNLYRFPSNVNEININPLSSFFFDIDGLFIVDGIVWTSIVQYYFAQKFIYIPDIVENIKNTHDTKELMRLYSIEKLPHSKQNTWNRLRSAIFKRGIYAKFEQNIKLYMMLMNIPLSALNSVTDDIDELVFEIETKRVLYEIRDHFAKHGHPLIDKKFGDLKPQIKDTFKKYHSSVLSSSV